MAVIPWNKLYGETLKYMVERFRTERPEYREAKNTYAGRLDPMAEGLVILLTDKDVHRKQEFLELDKTYRVEFILGVATDTYDILGMITEGSLAETDQMRISESIRKLMNMNAQAYPSYSSKTVRGKPLWLWQREGRIDEIDIPKRAITIHSIDYLGYRDVLSSEFEKQITSSIDLVQGDFRQEAIKASWHEYFKQERTATRIYSIEVQASSGTYMRGLVDTLGRELGCGATTLKITRIQVGKFRLDD